MLLLPVASLRTAPVSAVRRDTTVDVSRPAETAPAGSFDVVVSYSYVSLIRATAPASPHESADTERDAAAVSMRSFAPVGVAYTVRTHRSSSLRERSLSCATAVLRPRSSTVLTSVFVLM